MQLSNLDIINAINGIGKVKEIGINLPGRVGYTIKQNSKSLIQAYQAYISERNGYNKDAVDWKESINELLSAEVEIPIAIIRPDILFDGEYPTELFDYLDFMIKED